MNLDGIKKQAQAEIDVEDMVEAVKIEKEKIRARRNRSWWQKNIPWKITIERR